MYIYECIDVYEYTYTSICVLMLYISLKFKYGHMPYSRIHNQRIISYHIKQFKVLYTLIHILLDNETLSICIPYQNVFLLVKLMTFLSEG